MNSAGPLTVPLATPPALPASSPVETQYCAPRTMGMHPSVVTVRGPLTVSAERAEFGYGIGTGPVGVGVRHTSGNTTLVPPLPLWAMPRPLA